MGPWKRTKPNLPEEADSEHSLATPQINSDPETAQQPLEATEKQDDGVSTTKVVSSSSTKLQNSPPSKSWYGGSWRQGSNKASPVTQVARESISAATSRTSELVFSAAGGASQKARPPLQSSSTYLSRSMGASSKSLPLAPSTTKSNIPSNLSKANGNVGVTTSPGHGLDQKQEPSVHQDKLQGTKSTNGKKTPGVEGLPSVEVKEEEAKTRPEDDIPMWRWWFSKPTEIEPQESLKKSGSSENISTSPVSGQDPPDSQTHVKQRRNSDPCSPSNDSTKTHRPQSWSAFWGATRSAKAEPNVVQECNTIAQPGATQTAQNPGESIETSNVHLKEPETQSLAPAKSYKWAFWSKETLDKSRDGFSADSIGTTALVQPASPARSENTVTNKPTKVSSLSRKGPQSVEQTLHGTTKGSSQESPTANDVEIEDRATTANKKIESHTQNSLLPLFHSTYPATSKLTFFESLSRFWLYKQSKDIKHVSFLQEVPRIKRALAIGIHGYFPAPLLRSVLGQPTGTSIRFADGAAKAIERWTSKHGFTCETEKVALEGEGKILERLDLLWNLLLNWIENIRRADFVFLACHSQGVPVAIMLIAKLIKFGCIQNSRIGICAMAGVNLGPFSDYRSRWIGGSAGELFDFGRPDSQVSQDYKNALDFVLRSGVRVAYIGSIDDQLVSLESSTFGTMSHPYIYRAVFIDGRTNAPNFLTHLVGFALKLRNLGISDHGLIRELSSALAGSLYGGEGHSRLYEDDAVYYLAVQNALETTSLGEIPLEHYEHRSAGSVNPYILPFAVRGVLEESYVKNEAQEEITDLLKQFDDWKPLSKVLKDIKFRLEGIRSKL